MNSRENRGCILKPRLTPNMERLRGTLEAVKRDKTHFNQALWVSSPNSKKYPEQVGCVAWFAVRLYGSPKQIESFTWVKAHDWVGPQILGLSRKNTTSLFCGGNTIEMIEEILDRWENET